MKTNKAFWIIVDALILFAVSTFFVFIANMAFSGLKGKTPKDDPVVTAITQGNIKELQDAATAGKNVAGPCDEHGRTALMRAAYVNLSTPALTAESDGKRSAMIPLLLENGASLDQQDNDGWTALMWASWSGTTKVAAILLEKGASHALADPQGNTALTIAARRGNAEIVRQLIACGADKSATTRTGKTALDQANAGLMEYPDHETTYKEVISLLGGY